MTERILVADDDLDVSRLVAVNLTLEGYDVLLEHDGAATLATAVRTQPDLILLDVMMPELDGYEVCKQLREDPRTANAAIILLTARSLSADRVLGLTAGADDYIAKPFDPPELVARVKSVLRRSRQMRDASPLTGLPGNFQITAELDRVVRHGARFALTYCDLDNFKAYNDHYGFVQGDEAIKATARLLVEVLARHPSELSFVGHIGGDDFVLVTSTEVADDVAADVVQSFGEMAPTLYADDDRARGFIEVVDRQSVPHRYPIMTISVGVASSQHRQFASPVEASAVATEMKVAANQEEGSAYRIDRRRA